VPNQKYELIICFNDNILKGRKMKMALYASKIVRCVVPLLFSIYAEMLTKKALDDVNEGVQIKVKILMER